MQINVTTNVPEKDDSDRIAELLYQVFNEGAYKDAKFTGLFFAKPYLDSRLQYPVEEMQARQFYCDELKNENNQNVPYSYAYREWGHWADKLLVAMHASGYRLAKVESLPDNAGATEGLV
jgi:hypothetical protein